MYLKYIRAEGFKSFADKLELEIKPGITGVVGPNGSGKSNIVDAIRWVLGEQSVKALRGDNAMSDIIFAGSKSRKGNTRAVVSLTFDNSDNYLNSEFKEVEIKRVLYKTGDNEYYINNTRVRLKDVIDLFLDTGASKESFNIISQGAVVDVINSKPESRRVIFEEAAGVLKYKKRKEDTLKKISKTNDNIEKINLLTNELLGTLEPLKEQAEVAKKYIEYKDKLEKQEIALIANDITIINKEYQDVKEIIEKTSKELQDLSNNYTSSDNRLEKLKLDNIKIDESIDNKNKSIMFLVNSLSELQSQKQINIERQKYKVDDQKLEGNIINLKEDIFNIENNINIANKDIDNIKVELNVKELELLKCNKDIDSLDIERKSYNNEINRLDRELLQTKNRIDIINDNIANDTKLPYAVKSIISNVRLEGVKGVLAKLIDVDDKYSMAIEVSLGANSNVIVVEDENVAKKAIKYLKENKLGRATFYPMNIIKGRSLDKDVIANIINDKGYIGIASDLVKYDKRYKEIVLNQLGNIIIVDNIDSMNRIGKLVNYKYRVVSLDGDILYSGGAISGGINKVNRGILLEKKEIDDLEREYKNKKIELDDNNDYLEKINNKYKDADSNRIGLITEISALKEKMEQKNTYLIELSNNLNNKKSELEGINNISSNSLNSELDDILKKYYEVSNNKDILEKELSKLKNDKFTITNEINELEKEYRNYNSKYNFKQNILKNEEIKLGKLDVKLDSLLLVLNENYSMTYERAKEEYILDDDAETVRLSVNNLKAKIMELGEVNTGSISEYERLNTRYNFLDKQRKDLEDSIDSLLNIITEMDEIMKSNFISTFEKIRVEFSKVFKELFKGGDAVLELTDPDNLLETGVEISALPPGKKLNSIALLSGGEKTLTAIALLFAILNVKPVPFVVLDEVEAALDEANVESFGNYLKSKKDNSQFIIITHKKKTMEYADALYGITMQESGVSKLVSVRLED